MCLQSLSIIDVFGRHLGIPVTSDNKYQQKIGCFGDAIFCLGVDGRGNTCPTTGDQPVFCQLFKSGYYRLAGCLVFPLLMPLILIVQLNLYQVRIIPHGTHMSHKTLAGNMQGTDIDFQNANMRYHERWDFAKSPSCHLIYYHLNHQTHLLSSTIIYISIYHLNIIYIIYDHLFISIQLISWKSLVKIGLFSAPRHRPAPALQAAPFLQKPLDMAKASDLMEFHEDVIGIYDITEDLYMCVMWFINYSNDLFMGFNYGIWSLKKYILESSIPNCVWIVWSQWVLNPPTCCRQGWFQPQAWGR